jgi:hypothetical protein
MARRLRQANRRTRSMFTESRSRAPFTGRSRGSRPRLASDRLLCVAVAASGLLDCQWARASRDVAEPPFGRSAPAGLKEAMGSEHQPGHPLRRYCGPCVHCHVGAASVFRRLILARGFTRKTARSDSPNHRTSQARILQFRVHQQGSTSLHSIGTARSSSLLCIGGSPPLAKDSDAGTGGEINGLRSLESHSPQDARRRMLHPTA